MSGAVVVELRPGRSRQPDVAQWVSKAELAAHPFVCRSTRWIEQQVRKGMPADREPDGITRKFDLNAALAWLRENHPGIAKRMEGSELAAPARQSPLVRIAELERENAELREQLAAAMAPGGSAA